MCMEAKALLLILVFLFIIIIIFCDSIQKCVSGLQITVGRQSLASQNLLVSDKIQCTFRHYVGGIFYRKSFYSKEK